ncbi:MAG: PEP-CTERM sorting domain-containing protein, partial [Phycisphaerae bacterium]
GADLRQATWYPTSSTITANTILPDGTIQGLALAAGETLVIRNNPLAITVNSQASFNPTSTLLCQLERNWSSVVQFSSGVTPGLDGRLDLELAAGVDPSMMVGLSLQLFQWNAPLDSADRFSSIVTDPRLSFDLSNLYTTGTITINAVPEPMSLGLLGLGGLLTLTRRRRRWNPS